MSNVKFLSYYKFTPAKWLSGEITLCSYEAKGMFIDLCALFWAKEGVLKESFVEQMMNKCSASVKQELFALEILSYRDGLLHINFLVEQLEEFEGISEKRSEAGRKSAESRKQNSTSVEQNSTSVDVCSTIKIREDKSIEDKIKEKEIKEKKIKIDIFVKPTLNEIKEFCLNENLVVDEEYFFNYYESNGWKIGKNNMKNWKATVKNWSKKSFNDNLNSNNSKMSYAELREQKNIDVIKNWEPHKKGF